jgi:hypothetical protein
MTAQERADKAASDRDKQAREYATSYLNGNRKTVCESILNGPNPAIMAALVSRKLCRQSFDTTDEFIRILTSVSDLIDKTGLTLTTEG